jgi:RNA 2',3'-cyclic 3'-phosphodiesterase
MHRLFAALRPPPEIREQLFDLMEGVPSARWQDDEQLHLTLRFIGEVDGRVADDVVAALGTMAHPPVEVALAGVGAFDDRGRVNALWAGVRPHDALARLHRKVDQALVRAGLEPERRAYLPHITVARFSRGDHPDAQAWIARHAGLASPPFVLSHFALYESHTTHLGAAYEVVERWPLAPS